MPGMLHIHTKQLENILF